MTQYEFMCKVRENGYSCCFADKCNDCPLKNRQYPDCGRSDNTEPLHVLRIQLVDNWIKQYEEEHMDKRQEALDRIKKAEAEIAEAKKLLEEPDPRIGKLCVIWDICSHACYGVVEKIEDGVYVHQNGSRWQHARLLTQEEKEKYL